ncbi:MAG: toprim domain-containing protein [Acidobacteria bacterium]|nr:toprim domain-containing protein [Acidobacteriota bacterium]
MAYPSDFAQNLKRQADIVRIVGGYVALRKAGAQNYSGLCPFHKEKTPSFYVHAGRQFYHCFGCGAAGDVFGFVQKIENVSFPEAVRAVAHKLGIALPKQTFRNEAEASDAKLRTALVEIHARACAFFEECLRRPEGGRAREYLAARGLTEETIRQFRVGFAPDSGFLLRDRLRNEFTEELLRESGLFSWKESTRAPVPGRPPGPPAERAESDVVAPPAGPGQEIAGLERATTGDAGRNPASSSARAAMYSRFRNRVMFPIANESGRVIAFTGRTLATDEKAGPKYLNSPETAIYSKSRVLFNLDQAKEAIRALGYAILVEGQMDSISVFAAGFRNVIASSGTAFSSAQAQLLGRFTKQVVMNFDPDAAGAKATERTLGLLVEEEFDIRVLTLEAGFDPDLFIRRKGKEAYAAALRSSGKYFHYLIERARQQFAVRSAEGKLKAVNYLLPHIQRVPSRIVRDEIAEEVAQKLNIDSAVLRQELKHAATMRGNAAVKAAPESQVTEAERILVRALASATQFHDPDHTSGRSGADDRFDPARQAQYVLSSERLQAGMSTESLIDALMNAAPETGNPLELPLAEGDRQLLASILLKEDEELTAEKLEGAVRALERMQIRRRLEQIQSQLESLRNLDAAQLRQLMQEKVRLKRALMNPGPPGEMAAESGGAS